MTAFNCSHLLRVVALRTVVVAVAVVATTTVVQAQDDNVVSKQLHLAPRSINDATPLFRLLPSEEEQEEGNAVPVLLRMTYEQTHFMANVYGRLNEYAEMEVDNPKLRELAFDSFAKQIIRAGSMSFAEWEYPLQSERPYGILLPDIQSQRQITGHGMTAWIKQGLAAGETMQALEGIRAQVACGRHCASTPIFVCQLVGLAIANAGLDNLELAIQQTDAPNLYSSLAVLPPTLQDVGKMVRWELQATPVRLKEPLPAIGSDAWKKIAEEFSSYASEWMDEPYTTQEAKELLSNLERLAKHDLLGKLHFTADEILKMSTEERVMRWLNLQFHLFRAQVEPLSYAEPQQILAAKAKIEAANRELLASTGAKQSPFPLVLPQAVLICRNFERRVRFLQTIEALRDHLSKHQTFPADLASLDYPAPNDPFTGQPFPYEPLKTGGARLSQASIDGWTGTQLKYVLFAPPEQNQVEFALLGTFDIDGDGDDDIDQVRERIVKAGGKVVAEFNGQGVQAAELPGITTATDYLVLGSNFGPQTPEEPADEQQMKAYREIISEARRNGAIKISLEKLMKHLDQAVEGDAFRRIRGRDFSIE